MPAIDSLLRLIASQNAESLSLASDQVPRLSRGGAATPLSMPAVAASMMDIFVSEVLSPEQVAQARAGDVTVEYDQFVVMVQRKGDGWAMIIKRRTQARARERPPLLGANAPAAAFTSPAPAAPAAAPDLLDHLLRQTLDTGASDLILSTGQPPRLRLADGLVSLEGTSPTDDQLLSLLGLGLADAHRTALAQHGSCDLALVRAGARFRVSVFRHIHGLGAAFRPVRRDPPTLAELDLDESLHRLVDFPNGLVLVTGPTGSGKSTTLVALIEQLNRSAARHIITLEDPIEYEYTSAQSLVHQRELGPHVDTFESGLRAALREAPDVILVGEMRDRGTIAAALTAAETGHLVLSTLHAGGAAMAVERIVDVFPEHQQKQVRAQLAGTLRAVLTQFLLPGPRGRVPVVELMVANSATSALIRDGKTHQLATAIQTGEGMIPLDRSLAARVEARQLSLETATRVTLDGGLQLRELLGRGKR